MGERIEYESCSPFEIHHLLNQLDSTPKHPVFGELFLPTGEGPFACVVACHGSRGWSDHHMDHANHWLDAGIAVFRIHSFDSRQVESVVDNQMLATHAMMLVDAFAALGVLNDDPRIDSNKIGIAGWSLGGTVALYAAWEPIISAFGNHRFAAHLPFYPAAHMRPVVQDWSNAPVLILHGDADDWTPIHFVKSLMPQIPDVQLHEYAGCHHAFDSIEPKTWLPHAIHIDDKTVEIDAGGMMSGELEPGVRMPLNEPAERFAAFQILQNIGAHACGDAEARADAMERASAFWVSHLA